MALVVRFSVVKDQITPLRQGVGFLGRRIPAARESSGIYRAISIAVSVVQMPARHNPGISISALWSCVPSCPLAHCFAPLTHGAFSNMFEKSPLVDVTFHAVIPYGSPRVQFHLNRRFLRRKLVSGLAGESRSPIKVEHTCQELDTYVVELIQQNSCDRVSVEARFCEFVPYLVLFPAIFCASS